MNEGDSRESIDVKNPNTALQTSTELSQSLEQLQKVITQMSDELCVVELQKSLPSCIQAISPFVAQLMSFLANFRNADGRDFEIEMAVSEALANAVVHGNHENPHKFVHVLCRCSTGGEISVTVRDQGQGFDSRAIPDPTAADNLCGEHGRGIYLMRAFMDEVTFEEGGTVVHMRKKSNDGSAASRKVQ